MNRPTPEPESCPGRALRSPANFDAAGAVTAVSRFGRRCARRLFGAPRTSRIPARKRSNEVRHSHCSFCTTPAYRSSRAGRFSGHAGDNTPGERALTIPQEGSANHQMVQSVWPIRGYTAKRHLVPRHLTAARAQEGHSTHCTKFANIVWLWHYFP